MENSAVFLFIWEETIHTTKLILDLSLLFCPYKGVTRGRIQKSSLDSSAIDWDSVPADPAGIILHLISALDPNVPLTLMVHVKELS